MTTDSLPNADQAYVEPAKVRDYLLAPREKDDKAGFFTRFGFRRDQWEVLRAALLEHGRSNPVARTLYESFRVKYNVEGPLRAHDGRWPLVRTVWAVETGQTAPRLISAYPIRRRRAEGT